MSTKMSPKEISTGVRLSKNKVPSPAWASSNTLRTCTEPNGGGQAHSPSRLELRYLDSDMDSDRLPHPPTPPSQFSVLQTQNELEHSLSWHIVGRLSLHSCMSRFLYFIYIISSIGCVSLENPNTTHNAVYINCPVEHFRESSSSISHVLLSKPSELTVSHPPWHIHGLPFSAHLCVVSEIYSSHFLQIKLEWASLVPHPGISFVLFCRLSVATITNH